MKRIFFFCLALTFFCLAQDAQALKIGNCDKVSHFVTIENSGEKKTTSLAAGRSIIVIGPSISAGIGGRKLAQLDTDYDYCIWRGSLEVQQRNTQGHPAAH